MKQFLILTFVLSTIAGRGQSPLIQWVNQNGGTNAVTTTHMSIDAAGCIYSAGFFSGTIDLDPGPGIMNATTVGSSDIFITKTDAAGNFIWGRTYGSSGADEALHIAVRNDRIFVCGFFLTTIVFDAQQPGGSLQSFGDFDAFVLRLDTAGQFTWASQLGGGLGDIAHSLAIDLHGDIVVVGQFAGTADFDPSPAVFHLVAPGNFGSDGFAVKLNQQGQLAWAKQLGGTNSDIATEVSLSHNGSIYIGGHFRATADMDPGPGTSMISSSGGDDAFVLKLDSSGQFLWTHKFGNTGFDLCNSLTSEPQGGVIMTGPFQNTLDADPGPGTELLTASGNVSSYLIHLDSNGQFGFALALKGSANVNTRHIRSRSDGNIYVSGNHNGTSILDPSGSAATVVTNGVEDAFLLALDAAGNTRWLIHFGSSGSDDALGIGIDPAYNLYLCGKFAGICNFSPSSGGPILTPAASRDGYTMKIDDPLITSTSHHTRPHLFGIFPNPTSGAIHLSGPTDRETTISVINQNGESLWIDENRILPATLDLQHLPAGVYILNCKGSHGMETLRVIRTH